MNSGFSLYWFVYQQDYLWFLGILGWGALAGVWWRLGRKDGRLRWLPWAAFVAIATAGLEISKLITPIVMKPFVAPWLVWDLALGGLHALMVCGLWWTLARVKSWPWRQVFPVYVAAFVAAAWRYSEPASGACILAILALLAVAGLIRNRGLPRSEQAALLALAVTVLFASNGPVTEWLKSPYRYTEISAWGLLAGGLSIASLLALGRSLYRPGADATGPEATHVDFRLLVWTQTGWLMLGLMIAAIMSHWARVSFESNLLARVRMGAELIDPDHLASVLSSKFRVDEISVFREYTKKEMRTYRLDALDGDGLRALSDSLGKIELANPDVDWATVMTLRGGWLIQYGFSSRMPAPLNNQQGIYGRPDQNTWQAWVDRRAGIYAPITIYYGTVVQGRSPLLDKQGRMLGWLVLDLGVAHWIAAQVQARLLAFAIIALGGALLFGNWQHRVRERLRAATQRKADSALAASRVKTAFLAKVSHELRTPIQSLLGYSELLRQRVDDDPKAMGWILSLQQHGELMTRLVNDLIDLSAVEAGAFQLQPKLVSPADVLTQTVESFRPRAEAKNLTLACFVGSRVPERVSLDGERFRQVILNLVGNAVKFTDAGGVTVSLESELPGWLVLTVRDTGPGILPADQGRLFVAFSRLELTAAKEGSGLGLALSAGLCRAMEGNLRVESDGSTGARFIASFHAIAVSATKEPSAVEQVVALRGYRVLVVDDNPLVRELFVAFLTEQGTLCAAAADGGEALAQAATSPFDVVILDLALPDGDGAQFVGPLLTLLPEVRVVGVSAHASSSDRARALAAGMHVFLTKPVSLAALAAAIAPQLGNDSKAATLPEFRTAEALRERLIRGFSRDVPGQRTGLTEAVAARDWVRVRALAHYLKNSAVVLRDDALFDVCTGLENAAAAADELAVGRWSARCTAALDRWLP